MHEPRVARRSLRDFPGGGMSRVGLGGLLAFIALNAFAGGLYGIAGADGVPVEWLTGTPFRSYRAPSLILFVAVGGSSLAAAVLVFRRSRSARRTALIAGSVMLAWIASQVAIIGLVSWLQPAVAVAALAIMGMAARLSPSAFAPDDGHPRSVAAVRRPGIKIPATLLRTIRSASPASRTIDQAPSRR